MAASEKYAKLVAFSLGDFSIPWEVLIVS